ncbi:MAG TPA: molybdopterin-dependent oxidoreductase [Polyangiales bacterium]|nr:molybdopterin-dependent oxidoreductase [Polyangiales bacterium]
MSTEHHERLSLERRRFVLRTLSIGGGALLGAVAGCRDSGTPTIDGSASEPKPPTEPEATAPKPAAPALPDGKDPANFIKHGDNPLTLETRREKLGTSVLTATSVLFVRQNLPLPPPEFVADRDGWTTRVEGVERPGDIRVDELKRLGLMTIATVLQCSGNGRKYYKHDPSGSPWGVGAAGCVMWSGVPLRDVVAHLGGVAEGMRYLTTTGGEPLPEGLDRNQVVVERSIPIEKALDDCLLAWEMNGEPIPRSHGGPLRLIVPGYFGCNQIKFVKNLAFTRDQGPAKIQQTGYRMRPIGEPGSPDQPAMWEMPVKSFITLPTDQTPVVAAKVRVTGVAFGGTKDLARAEVSTDGKSWQKARWVGPDLGRYAWRVFELELEREPGPVKLYCRAVTADGEVQPELRNENERGYGNNSWRDMGVTVQVCHPDDAICLTPPKPRDEAPTGPRKPVVLSESGKRGRKIFRETAQPPCMTCHTLSDAEAMGAVGPNLDELGRSVPQIEAAVTNGVGAMPPFGETLTDEQISDVARYVYEATRRD